MISLCCHALPSRYRMWIQKSSVPIIWQPNNTKHINSPSFYFKQHFHSLTILNPKYSGYLCYCVNTTWQQALLTRSPCLKPLTTTLTQNNNSINKHRPNFFQSLNNCLSTCMGLHPCPSCPGSQSVKPCSTSFPGWTTGCHPPWTWWRY